MSEHQEQPMPVPNGRPSIQGLVRADLEQREQVGIQRYGTPLQPFNGRDALRDLYEELLDGACYARQAIEERQQESVDLDDKILAAVNALAAVLEDERLGTYKPRITALLRALEWLEGDVTCGDCIEGRCHWGGEKSRASIAAAEAGEEYYEPGWGTCGCARHEVSVEARQRHVRLSHLTADTDTAGGGQEASAP